MSSEEEGENSYTSFNSLRERGRGKSGLNQYFAHHLKKKNNKRNLKNGVSYSCLQ